MRNEAVDLPVSIQRWRKECEHPALVESGTSMRDSGGEMQSCRVSRPWSRVCVSAHRDNDKNKCQLLVDSGVKRRQDETVSLLVPIVIVNPLLILEKTRQPEQYDLPSAEAFSSNCLCLLYLKTQEVVRHRTLIVSRNRAAAVAFLRDSFIPPKILKTWIHWHFSRCCKCSR